MIQLRLKSIKSELMNLKPVEEPSPSSRYEQVVEFNTNSRIKEGNSILQKSFNF